MAAPFLEQKGTTRNRTNIFLTSDLRFHELKCGLGGWCGEGGGEGALMVAAIAIVTATAIVTVLDVDVDSNSNSNSNSNK